MGLDMYLNRVPNVSEETLKEFNRRLTKASFDDSEAQELKKIEDELGYEVPVTTYDFVDVDRVKVAYDKYQSTISTSTDEKKVAQAKEELEDLLIGWGRTSIGEQAMYWRKANQIHKWFVDNVQYGEDDCGTYDVSSTQLVDLLSAIEVVLDDNNLAEEVLPNKSGCFFGSIDYDEWYFQDLEETRVKFKKLLRENEKNGDKYKFQYRASW